jgi:hypothetical protein
MRIRYLLLVALALPVIAVIIRWLAVMIAALLRGPGSNCPMCLSKRTRESKPRVLDRLRPAIFVARRCENCQRRFLMLQSVKYARRAKAAGQSSRPMVPAGSQISARR